MKRLLLAPVAFVSIGAVHAADPPSLKEGLWSIHTVSTDQPGNKKTEGTRSICRNRTYDERVRAQAKAKAMACKIHTENYAGSKYESESECAVQGMTIHTKGITTASGEYATHTESSTTYPPAFNGISAATMIM